jgi:hypothetical protein
MKKETSIFFNTLDDLESMEELNNLNKDWEVFIRKNNRIYKVVLNPVIEWVNEKVKALLYYSPHTLIEYWYIVLEDQILFQEVLKSMNLQEFPRINTWALEWSETLNKVNKILFDK